MESTDAMTMTSGMDPGGLYESLMATSVLSSAKFVQSNQIVCYWTYKHRASNSSVSLLTQHDIACKSSDYCQSSAPIPAESLLLSAGCPKHCCKAYIRKAANKNDPLYLEIIRRNLPVLTTSLKSVCSSIPKNNILAGAAFSMDCSAFTFIGDKFETPRKSFWPSPDSPIKPGESLGTEYDYVPNWGEGIPQRHPVVIIAEIGRDSLTAKRLESFGDDCSWGQVSWHPTAPNVLLATGFPNDSHRLGLLHYQTRPCAIYKSDNTKDGRAIKLTESDHSPSFGRFSPNGKHLAYFTTDNVQWHGSCCRCRIYDWDSQQSRTVVDIIRDSDEFPGLFLRGAPEKIWLSDSKTIVISTQWRCQMALIAINIDTGGMTRISLPHPYQSGCADVLDIYDNTLLVKIEDINRAPIPMLCTITTGGDGKLQFGWRAILDGIPCPPPELPAIKYEFIRTPISGSNASMESILIYPEQYPERSRLILFPHGGPHSGFSTNYSINQMYMLSMGFSLLLVNYRGSTGFGQDSLESLPGKCGKQDVDDCMSVLETVLSEKSVFSRDNIAVTGGSHGGFLTLWLIGQYPTVFKAAVARNPVANIAHMISTSDIPDWCAVECGIPFDAQMPLTGQQYQAMYEASPINVIRNVRTPLLLMLGDADKRCPMSQSIDYYKQLCALGSPCRCIVYPDNGHSLTDRVDTEADHWLNAVKWLQQ